MPSVLEIPLKGAGDQVIELDADDLPPLNEIFDILIQEQATLNLWISLALIYDEKKDYHLFEEVMRESYNQIKCYINDGNRAPCLNYPEFKQDIQRVLNMMGAYHVQKAKQTKEVILRGELLERAKTYYSQAEKYEIYNINYLLGKGLLAMNDDNLDQALNQLKLVETLDTKNIPMQLMHAVIAFRRKPPQYKEALNRFKYVLTYCKPCPPDVRLGMGYCFFKLGRLEKATMAFERTLQLDPKNVNALLGLAIIETNRGEIRKGVQLLSAAYKIDPNHPMVLNHLANHFFFKKDHQKVETLAHNALIGSDVDAIKAESCYQMARAYHCQHDMSSAFNYYYQATNLAAPSYVLPHLGMAQLYIDREGSTSNNAAGHLEKVLLLSPENYETMKILGSIYASSDKADLRDKAKDFLKKVTYRFPDDFEAWIEYAQILQSCDLPGSLSAYDTAIKVLQDNAGGEVTPDIYNNLGVIHFRLHNLDEANRYYHLALERCIAEEGNDPDYYTGISVTIQYNLGRLYESLNQTKEAEQVYKDILKGHPNYNDCYIRIGCICRNRGLDLEAFTWFKDSLRCKKDIHDVWTLIGNVFFSRNQFNQAQKKYDRILKDAKQDTYALVAMGNIYLQSLYTPDRDRERHKKNIGRALDYFRAAMKFQPRNIYAAHGIGCVLAYKGCIAEARDVFAQVREATADFADVWINIANIYVEQKQFQSAIVMYENCIKKFGRHHQNDLSLLLARAYFRSGKLTETKKILLKARRINPNDQVILFNLALVLQKLAMQTLEDPKSELSHVVSAVHELTMSQKYFHHLAQLGSKAKVDVSFAVTEANQCRDFLTQAQYHVARAKQKDEEEREQRKKQEEEREALRYKAELIEQQKREEVMVRTQEQIAKRHQFIEQSKSKMLFDEMPDEKAKGRGRGHGGHKKDHDEFVNDGDSSDDDRPVGEGDDGRTGDRESRKRKADGEGGKDKKKRRKDGDKKVSRSKGAKKEGKSSRKKEGEVEATSQRKGHYKSKEFVSDSDSDEESDENAKANLVIDSDASGGGDGDDGPKDHSQGASPAPSGSGSDGGNKKKRKRSKKEKKRSKKRVRTVLSDSDDSDLDVPKKKSKKKFDLNKFQAIGSGSDEDEAKKSDGSGDSDRVQKRRNIIGSDSDDNQGHHKSDSEVERSPNPDSDKDDSDHEAGTSQPRASSPSGPSDHSKVRDGDEQEVDGPASPTPSGQESDEDHRKEHQSEDEDRHVDSDIESTEPQGDQQSDVHNDSD